MQAMQSVPAEPSELVHPASRPHPHALAALARRGRRACGSPRPPRCPPHPRSHYRLGSTHPPDDDVASYAPWPGRARPRRTTPRRSGYARYVADDELAHARGRPCAQRGLGPTTSASVRRACQPATGHPPAAPAQPSPTPLGGTPSEPRARSRPPRGSSNLSHRSAASDRRFNPVEFLLAIMRVTF